MPRQATARPRDAASCEALFVEHAAFVARLLRRLGVSRDDLDDVVQDVFVVVHRSDGYRTGAATPRTWLASICVRMASTYRRRARRRGRREDPIADSIAADDDVYRELVAAERIGRVRTALDMLSTRDATMIVLRELEGLSTEELAQALQIPLGTVYSRLATARRRFREALGLAEDDPAALPFLHKQTAR